MAKEKTLTIVWRDENYSRIHDAFAFRSHVEPHPSDTEAKKVARIYKKHGFETNMQRAAWIAEFAQSDQPDLPIKLVEALKDAGYTVKNAGAVPEVLSEAVAGLEA